MSCGGVKSDAKNIIQIECNACGKILIADKPFIEGIYYGVKSGACECGKGTNGCNRYSSKNKKWNEKWKSILSKFIEIPE